MHGEINTEYSLPGMEGRTVVPDVHAVPQVFARLGRDDPVATVVGGDVNAFIQTKLLEALPNPTTERGRARGHGRNKQPRAAKLFFRSNLDHVML